MILTRSHVWTPLQKGLILAGVLIAVCSLGVAIYSYERYYRGPSDSILVGDWEIPGTDTPLCYHFDPDHSFYVGGCGENEPVARGRWYAGGRNLYLKWAPDDADYLGFKRPQIFHITDVEPSALSLATSHNSPPGTYPRFVPHEHL